MCYTLHNNGRVRFYPDEEFHKNVKSTLAVLNNGKYTSYLGLFNNILDELYEKHNHESPIKGLFECIETFGLLTIRGVSDRLENTLITKLFEKIKENICKKNQYSENDFDALEAIREVFSKWVKACHKYRHGKPDQEDKIIPEEIFNYLFSTGVSIFRFLLETNDKYSEF